MKQFYVWTKFASAILAILGIFLTIYIWAFVAGADIPIDLIGRVIMGVPVIDWLMTLVNVSFLFLAFVYSYHEYRTRIGLLSALPLFALNALMLVIWWTMELLGNSDMLFVCMIMAVVMMANMIAAGMYVFRPTKSSYITV